jgi:transcriptional regulator with XRE-family HTH domain
MEQSAEKTGFAERLNEVCSDMELPVERGRQSALAAVFKVTPNAARKWLLGLGMPELDVAIAIAKWGNVNVEWLLSGRGPKRGNLVATKALILDEALRTLPAEERREALDYIKYKLERARAVLTGEQIARYSVALDQFLPEQPPEPRPAGPTRERH